jgi:transcriptional regulator with XRE-family HTH domain
MKKNIHILSGTFGSRLFFAIQSSGLTQTEFAKKINIDRHHLNHFIHSRRLPDFDKLRAIIYGLPNIDARWLITGLNKR